MTLDSLNLANWINVALERGYHHFVLLYFMAKLINIYDHNVDFDDTSNFDWYSSIYLKLDCEAKKKK